MSNDPAEKRINDAMDVIGAAVNKLIKTAESEGGIEAVAASLGELSVLTIVNSLLHIYGKDVAENVAASWCDITKSMVMDVLYDESDFYENIRQRMH